MVWLASALAEPSARSASRLREGKRRIEGEKWAELVGLKPIAWRIASKKRREESCIKEREKTAFAHATQLRFINEINLKMAITLKYANFTRENLYGNVQLDESYKMV